jgi:hypothetical protein
MSVNVTSPKFWTAQESELMDWLGALNPGFLI